MKEKTHISSPSGNKDDLKNYKPASQTQMQKDLRIFTQLVYKNQKGTEVLKPQLACICQLQIFKIIFLEVN